MHDLPGKPCPGLPNWDMLHTRAVQTHSERASGMAFLATRQPKPNLCEDRFGGVWCHAMRLAAKEEKLVFRKLRVSSKLDKALASSVGAGSISENHIKRGLHSKGTCGDWLP